MSNLIFLSHSTKDKDLVDRFVDFLDVTFKIDRSEIYCTSLKGTKRIRTGDNFINDIRENITSTEVVLYLTPNFLKSNFCLSELGASWALGKKIYPILVPPLEKEALKSTPLNGVAQFLELKSEDALFDMADEFKDMGIINEISTGLLKAKARSFFEDMPKLLFVESEDNISKGEYDKVKKEMDEIMDNNIEQEQIIRELKNEIEHISALKDSDQIMEYRMSKRLFGKSSKNISMM